MYLDNHMLLIELSKYYKRPLNCVSNSNASIIDRHLIESFNQKIALDKVNYVKKLVRLIKITKYET